MVQGPNASDLEKFFFDSTELLAIFEPDGVFRVFNSAWCGILGWEYDELAGHHFRELLHPDDIESSMAAFALSVQGLNDSDHFSVNRLRCKDGSYKWIEWRSRFHEGRAFESGRDITTYVEARTELTRSLATIRAIFDEASDTIVVLDSELRVVMESAAIQEELGFKAEERIGRISYVRVHPDDQEMVQSALRSVFETGAKVHLRYRFQHADGHWMMLDTTGRALAIEGDSDRRAVFIACDVTQEEEDQRRLAEVLSTKTAIFNTAADIITLVDPDLRVIETNASSTKITGLAPVDGVGHRITEFVESADAGNLEETMGVLFESNDNETRSSTFGVIGFDGRHYYLESRARVLRDSDGNAVQAVIVSSDVTEAVARETALRESLEAHEAALRAEARRVSEGVSKIRDIIDGRAISIVFQPIVELQSGASIGYESLSRFLQEPIRPPNLWFDEASELGVGVELELLAIDLALANLYEIPEGMFLTVNISPACLLRDEFLNVVSQVDLRRVVFELTEHEHVDDYAPIRTRMEELRHRGARFAVDDAGAGFASLQHILRLGPEWLKLDISIVHDVDVDPARRAMVAALIYFAHEVGTKVIAEGIETAVQQAELIEIGVEFGQGYHLGRPEPLMGQ